MMKKLPFLFALTIPFSLYNQTLTEAEFILPIGQFSVNMSVDQPSFPGANVIWDFTSLIVDSSFVMEFASPSTTPQAVNFPMANAVEIRSGNYPGNHYTYYELNANGWYDQGYATDTDFLIYHNFDDMQDPWTVLQFPCAFDSAWSDDLADEFWTSGLARNISVDGYGTLEMPYGSVTNVLRVNTYEYIVSWWAETGYTRTISYYKPGIGRPILVSVEHGYTGIGGGPPIHEPIEWVDMEVITGIGGSGLQSIGIELIPNPSSGIAQVVFSASRKVSIQLIDVTGRIVSTEYLGRLAPGIHSHTLDVSELPVGMYTIHIYNDNNERGVRRLMVEY